ncbi:MAG: hypothetical protein KBH78_10515, partial [Candidatus Hydrogenedentes bacterium]|nr:hypothetical protein [Candidatus Hydrogenedentota bacterium]
CARRPEPVVLSKAPTVTTAGWVARAVKVAQAVMAAPLDRLAMAEKARMAVEPLSWPPEAWSVFTAPLTFPRECRKLARRVAPRTGVPTDPLAAARTTEIANPKREAIPLTGLTGPVHSTPVAPQPDIIPVASTILAAYAVAADGAAWAETAVMAVVAARPAVQAGEVRADTARQAWSRSWAPSLNSREARLWLSMARPPARNMVAGSP